jgi:phage recombination protein Bet
MPTDTQIAKSSHVLPAAVADRGLSAAQWRALKYVLYPGAADQSIFLVIDYCHAMKLDPMRRPVHIVPMEVRIAGTDRSEWRDVPIPGIYLWRTIASRTGLYLGHTTPEYATEIIDLRGVKAPEWCAMTFWRAAPLVGMQPLAFAVKTFFREVVATNREGKPNARWSRAPVQMLTKCTEAAGLREAFPDEFGGTHTSDELDGQRVHDAPALDADTAAPLLPQPAGFDDWLSDLIAVSENGLDAFGSAWKDAPAPMRGYLMATDPDTYERLKQGAAAVSSAQPEQPHDDAPQLPLDDEQR